MNFWEVFDDIGDTFGRLDIMADRGKFHWNKQDIISAMGIRFNRWRDRI